MTNAANVTNTVIRPRPVRDARMRVFLLHHAGGSHLVYREWHRHFPHDWEVCLVEAPGRGVLSGVAPIGDADELVTVLLDDLYPLLDRPFAFFGHSMGALLSYELTLRLMAKDMPLPVWLGLSARSGPRPDGRPDPEQRHRLPDTLLRREVAEIGGTPADVLADDEMWAMVASLLRTDLRVVETWRPRPETPDLPMPVSVFGGEHDTVTGPERLGYWRDAAPDLLGRHMFDGDHFYFTGREAAVVATVVADIRKALSRARTGAEMTSVMVNGVRPDVLRCVADALGLDDGAIDHDRPLTDLGLQPYTAVQLRHRLREDLGVDLALAELLGSGSLRTISTAAGGPEAPAAQRLDRSDWSRLQERAATHQVSTLALLTAAATWTLSRWNLLDGGGLPVRSTDATVLLTLPDHDPAHWSGLAARARAVDARLADAGPADPAARHAVTFAYGAEALPADRVRLMATEDAGTLTLHWTAGADVDPATLGGARTALGRLLHLLATDQDAWQRTDLGWNPSFELPEPMAARPFGDAGPLLDDPLRRAAAAYPDAPAVISPEETLTHREVAERADRLGARLAQCGAGPGDMVAVVLDKGTDQIAAVLAVGRCGAGYVPIAPSWPAARVEAVCERAGLRFAIVPRGYESPLPEGVRPIHPDETASAGTEPRRATPGELAYAIFTSGSTGTPKGVAIEHRQARTTVDDITERFGVGPADRVLGLSALSFDLSVYDIFGVLGAGGALVLPDPSGTRDPEYWLELIAEHRVTVWNTAPALMEMLVDLAETDPGRAAAQLASLRLVMLSGDWIPVTLPDRLRALAPDVEIISLGGATEASIWSIWFPVAAVDPAWASIPYGRPLAGQFFHILDERGGPCPVGEPGELYIAGDGVARGYLGDAEQTALRFAVHPFLGERLYRTGDLGRWRTDGTIEFLGRADRQVKVQGHRIELGEIEAALDRLPGVRQAVASVDTAPDGRRTLVGHVAPAAPGAVPDEEFAAGLGAALGEHLPAYMVPSRFVVMDALPVTANGKIDYAALGSPAEDAPAGVAPGRAETPADGAWLAEAAREAAARGLRLSLCVSVASDDVTRALTAAGEWTRELRERLDAMGVPISQITAPGRHSGLVELAVGDGSGETLIAGPASACPSQAPGQRAEGPDVPLGQELRPGRGHVGEPVGDAVVGEQPDRPVEGRHVGPGGVHDARIEEEQGARWPGGRRDSALLHQRPDLFGVKPEIEVGR